MHFVPGGVATNKGVESTARHAWELGYSQVIVENGASGQSAELNNFAVGKIFPRISGVVRSGGIGFRA
jgi:nicotinamidase-related amidase